MLLFRVENGQEEEADDGEDADDDRALNDREKRRPDIPPALSLERDAGRV